MASTQSTSPQTPEPAVESAGTEEATKAAETDSASRWTFLTNHTHVLVVLHSNPDMVLREVAVEVGITERAVQRIIQDLETGGFIQRERIGRRNRYLVLVDKSLRHSIEAHRRIGDLLALVSGGK